MDDEAATGPLLAGSGRACLTRWSWNVTPELLRIEELAKEKSVLALLTHTGLSDTAAKAFTAGLGFLGADALDMPKLLGGVIGVGVQATAAAALRHRELSAEQRQSAYFYLFELDRRRRK